MKKLITLLLFTASNMQAQTTISFYVSSKLTTGAEVMFPVHGTDFYIGGGFSGAWDVVKTMPGHISEYDKKQPNQNAFREEWTSIYAVGSTGYLGKIQIKYKAGLAVYNDKVTFNNDYTKIDQITYRPLIGISGMYAIGENYGIELGADTFNGATIGFCAIF
ncbi:MAG: hypothetical protein V4497_09400 [Bacteroidota bacterium]